MPGIARLEFAVADILVKLFHASSTMHHPVTKFSLHVSIYQVYRCMLFLLFKNTRFAMAMTRCLPRGYAAKSVPD